MTPSAHASAGATSSRLDAAPFARSPGGARTHQYNSTHTESEGDRQRHHDAELKRKREEEKRQQLAKAIEHQRLAHPRAVLRRRSFAIRTEPLAAQAIESLG